MISTPYRYYDYTEVVILAAKGDTVAQLELDARIQNSFFEAQMEIVKSCRKGDLKELKIAEKALQAQDYKELAWIREDLKEYRDMRKKEEESYEVMREFALSKSTSTQLPDSLFPNTYRNVWGN